MCSLKNKSHISHFFLIVHMEITHIMMDYSMSKTLIPKYPKSIELIQGNPCQNIQKAMI